MSASRGVTLLLVEDNQTDAAFVERVLVEQERTMAERGVERTLEIRSIEHVRSLAEGIDRVAGGDIDITLLDLGLPDSNGIETVSTMLDHAGTVPVVVLTGRPGMGIEAIKHGAQEYLLKGEITGDALVRTITYAIERARITRKLHDRTHRLELINEILRTDLRNDISMIVGRADELTNETDADVQETVDAILDASHHVLGLTDTAAALIEMLSDDPTTEPRPFALSRVLPEVIERFQEETGGTLDVKWDATDDQPLTVAGSSMLGQVFEQLFVNALERSEGESPTITVTVEAADEHVLVSVADDGVRLSPSEKEHLSQLGTTSNDSARVSASLYFVTTVLDSIGAELSVSDATPSGSVVTVELDRMDVS